MPGVGEADVEDPGVVVPGADDGLPLPRVRRPVLPLVPVEEPGMVLLTPGVRPAPFGMAVAPDPGMVVAPLMVVPPGMVEPGVVEPGMAPPAPGAPAAPPAPAPPAAPVCAIKGVAMESMAMAPRDIMTLRMGFCSLRAATRSRR